MQTEHVGVVSGLADLANFLAAQRRCAGNDGERIRIVLFGQGGSLPKQLRSEFDKVVAAAFPGYTQTTIPSELVGRERFDDARAGGLGLEKTGRRIVYGNQIHKPFHLSFYRYLEPDEFVFFDNGLSSYWPHETDIRADFAAYGLAFPTRAYLSLHPPLPIPGYLADAPPATLARADYDDAYRAMKARARQKPRDNVLPAHLIIGTSLFRTNHIAWEEERALYMDLVAALRRRSDQPILFKTHPRAVARPLVTAADGVDVLDTIVPIEAFAHPKSNGFAYSIASTSLITLQKYYGFTPYRLDSPAVRRVAERMRHLDLTRNVSVFSDVKNSES